MVNRLPPRGALSARAVGEGRAAGGVFGGAVLGQGGEGRVLGENLGEENRLQSCQGVLGQEACSSSSTGGRWGVKPHRGLAAGDEGEVWEAHVAARHGSGLQDAGGRTGLLQLAQDGVH